MSEQCAVYRLGLVPYEEAWQLQGRLATQIAGGAQPPTLLLLEHPHTYTFGRRGHSENLLWDQEELSRRKITVLWVDRGGDVTYHGPGQLVGYPLLPMASGDWCASPIHSSTLHYDSFYGMSGDVQKTHTHNLKESNHMAPHLPQADYVGYLRKLEETVIYALRLLGVVGFRMKGMTGVWIKTEAPLRLPKYRSGQFVSIAKIAAIGVKVDARGVSRHGFALNVNPDMHYWEGIVGCGLKDYPVISLADLFGSESPHGSTIPHGSTLPHGSSLPHCQPTIEQVMDAIIVAFGKVFGCEMVELHKEVESVEE